MDYRNEIQSLLSNPQGLETLYQQAAERGEAAAFSAAAASAYQQAPENLLLAAWHYRLERLPAAPAQATGRAALWWLALPLAALTGLAIGWMASNLAVFLDHLPYFLLFWSPVAASLAIVFLVLAARREIPALRAWTPYLAVGLLLLAALYVRLIAPTQAQWYARAYLDQMALHLPLLAWIALGLALLGLRSLAADRFAFLIKSIEVVITAGLYLIAGVAFGLITFGMLSALSIQLPERWMLFLMGGGFGLLPLIALVSIYDPRLAPSRQDFSQGLSKFVANMMRLLLPLTLVVLAIYIVLIPFNFMEPFRNRDVLIVYNVMLFAIMGLLLGATPLLPGELAPKMKSTLRAGFLAVGGLALLVSLYALSAILYRTFNDTLTMNRLIIIGWNLINIAILGALTFRTWRAGHDGWIPAAQAVLSKATVPYVAWTLFVIFAVPLLFR